MLISVLIPTYNGGKFIKRTLNSILKYNHNILIWVYIDGSTDNTLEIINKMGSNKIKWIYSPINRGVNYARRKLFERVETKWFAYCDDDDVYTKKAFKYMLKTIKPESNFVTGTMLIKKNMFVKHVFNGEFKQILNPSLRKVLEKSGTSMNNHLFKSSFFRKLKYDPPPHAQMQEDVCFWVAYQNKFKCFSFTNRVTYKYIRRHGSYTQCSINYKKNQEIISNFNWSIKKIMHESNGKKIITKHVEYLNNWMRLYGSSSRIFCVNKQYKITTKPCS